MGHYLSGYNDDLDDVGENPIFMDDDEDDIFNAIKNFNPKLTSHSLRKCCMNNMRESDVPLYNWINRMGLCIKNINTIFDYLNSNSARIDVKNGKVLSGWSHRGDGVYRGGIPGSLFNLDSKAKDCAEYFYQIPISHGLDKEIAHVLFASILLNFKEFKQTLSMEPYGNFIDNECHPFLQLISRTLDTMGVSKVLFQDWITECTNNYFLMNSCALPLESLPDEIRNQMVIDGRNFESRLELITELCIKCHCTTQLLHREQQQRRIFEAETKASLMRIQHEQMTQTLILRDVLAAVHVSNNSSISTVEDRHVSTQSETNTFELPEQTKGLPVIERNHQNTRVDTKPKDKKLMYMWIHFKENFCDNKTSLADKYTMFVTNSNIYNDWYVSRVKIDQYSRSKNSEIKTIIRTMLRLIGALPMPPPITKNLSDVMNWTNSIRSQGMRAEKLLLEKLNCNDDSVSTTASPPFSKLIQGIRSLKDLPPMPPGYNTNFLSMVLDTESSNNSQKRKIDRDAGAVLDDGDAETESDGGDKYDKESMLSVRDPTHASGEDKRRRDEENTINEGKK